MSAIKAPRGKKIRALSSGTDLFDLETFSGIRPLENKFKSKSLPGKAPERRMRESEFSQLMKSKQAIRLYYGLKEGQFKRVYDKAAKAKGSTGENLLALLETRLDNIVYRAGFAQTRAQAKQLVSHGHIQVNGARLNIPSYVCKVGQTISVIDKSKALAVIASASDLAKQKEAVQWLEIDNEKRVATVSSAPILDTLNAAFKVNHVIELYSK